MKALVEGEIADPPKLGVVQNKTKNTKFRSYERETYEPDKLETTTTETKTMAPQKLEVRAEKKN